MKFLLNLTLMYIYILLSPYPVVASSLYCSYGENVIYDVTIESCCMITNTSDTIDDDPKVEIDFDAESVEGFQMIKYSIGKFPENIKNFTALIALEIFQCNLTKITRKNLENFKYLTILSLAKNKIQVIDAMLFKHNSKLEKINFEGNPIIHIDPMTFITLSETLTDLNLNQISCNITSKILNEITDEIENQKCTIADWKIIGDGYVGIVKALHNLGHDFEDLKTEVELCDVKNEELQSELDTTKLKLSQNVCSISEGETTPEPTQDLIEEIQNIYNENRKLRIENEKLEEEIKTQKYSSDEKNSSSQNEKLIYSALIGILAITCLILFFIHCRMMREKSSYSPNNEETFAMNLEEISGAKAKTEEKKYNF